MCRRTERGFTCCCDCSRVRTFCSTLSARMGDLCRPRMATSAEDVRTLKFWKAAAAEFLGTLFLVFIGCGSTMAFPKSVPKPGEIPILPEVDVVRIALAFGLTVAVIIYCIARISGGHINPAVSLAMLATRKISLARALVYCVAQLLGALVGALLVLGVTPYGYRGSLGATLVNPVVTPEQGFGVEFIITFLFIFVILATNDTGKEELKVWCPLLVGLTVVICHLIAVPYTGCGMNTARSFGPAVASGKWANHWIYWFGPIIGGMAGGLFYDYIFASNASLDRARACVMANEFEDNEDGKPRGSPEHRPMKPSSHHSNTGAGTTFVEVEPPEKVADTDPESDVGSHTSLIDEKRKSRTSLADEKKKSYTSLSDEKRKSHTSLVDEKRKSHTSLVDEKRKSHTSLVDEKRKSQTSLADENKKSLTSLVDEAAAEDVSTAKSVVG